MSESAPLEGIRVLELGVMIAVPAATHILASYGAEVIKVEDHTVGDTLRFFGSNQCRSIWLRYERHWLEYVE